jgi:hypothetical protein
MNTKSANVLENPLKKIYYYEITKLIGMINTLLVEYWFYYYGNSALYRTFGHPWMRLENLS